MAPRGNRGVAALGGGGATAVAATAWVLLVMIVWLRPWRLGNSEPGAPAGEWEARERMVAYAMEVLVPLDEGTRQMDSWTVELRGRSYWVADTDDFAALNREIWFAVGDAALVHVDALGIDPFELLPLCEVAIVWMMDQIDLTMVAMAGDPEATLAWAYVVMDSTGVLVDAVAAELDSLDAPETPPAAGRVDPAHCARVEADERERRGWPSVEWTLGTDRRGREGSGAHSPRRR